LVTQSINFFDILTWFAFCSVILLLTTEVISYFGAGEGFVIDKFRIRLVAIASGLIFLIALILHSSHIL